MKIPKIKFTYDIIATTGLFDPIFPRDIQFLEYSRSLGDELVVILFNDQRVLEYRGYTGINLQKRIARLEKLDCVDLVIPSQHGRDFRYEPFTEYSTDDVSIGYELEQLKPTTFVTHAKAFFDQNKSVCKDEGIKCKYVEMGTYEDYARKNQASKV